ncbi:MAG: O-antigen ligase family protein [Candidatus Parcubacteria bacterium]|nr:O-antigen ligase family protein [Candidatus Parcubacteria bacterium]
MKVLKWIWKNFLFVFTIFLLAFIPLYPKLPLLDIVNTWVYVRAEDFIVVLAVVIWTAMFFFKKVTLRTPLTIPILLFWIIGGLATLHGVLLIFPTVSGLYSNVAILSFFRRIEYIFLFFIAFGGIKDKKFMPYIVYALASILILVSVYGFGQKFLGFPAYLTMNEEFAKGIPIQLSQLSRVPSTFAGHYDLAAYLVLVIPILASAFFGFRNLFIKIFLAISVAMGFVLIFMTVSRVSFFVLLMALVMLLFLQKRKLLIASLFVITVLFLFLFPSLSARFGNTLKQVDVLVDAQTGNALGEVKDVEKSYFKDKVVRVQDKTATSSAVLPLALIRSNVILLVEPNQSTGESLPQGTGYINLPLSPVIKRESQFFFEKSNQSTESAEAQVFYGDYVVKKAFAYDLSFTTRFQGEWPRTFEAFKRNILFGSGYGSVSLAVDNNYLRILGESGLFGFLSFLSIFIITFIYIKNILPKVDSVLVRSFVLGFVAGGFGLALNATLIDVFEASKVAFTLWLLMGITLGMLNLYKTWTIDVLKEFKNVITSTPAIIIYLFVIVIALYAPALNYYFVGDDFTWFRWVADCHRGLSDTPCHSSLSMFLHNFTQSDGFFYRPGTKVYFSGIYSLFWLNQSVYHFISFILHFLVTALVFLISKRILKNHFLSIVTAITFAILSGYQEAVFWVSSTGFLFNAFFALLSILSFALWREKKKKIYFIVSILSIVFSLLFHELGVVVPLLIMAYDMVFGESRKLLNKTYLYLLLPLLPYLILRLIAHSHWFNGDYSYNLFKLPANVIGNAIGYIGLDLLGPMSMPLYNTLRIFSRNHILISILISIILIISFITIYKTILKKITNDEKRIVIFASLFFVISLLPFLGLGNITSRYSYLSSFGIVLLLVIFMKYVYSYLLSNGKTIAFATVTMIAVVFSLIHLFQLQKMHTDWSVSGEKSRQFLISLNQIYSDEARKKPMHFYFVDIPIKYGEAWIFPVGFEDALWFTFRNDQLLVDTKDSLAQALSYAASYPDARIFQVDKDGRFKEIKNTGLKTQ